MSELKITNEQAAYLNALRRSGVVNMFGAARYLSIEFEIGPEEAKKLLLEWIENYDELLAA